VLYFAVLKPFGDHVGRKAHTLGPLERRFEEIVDDSAAVGNVLGKVELVCACGERTVKSLDDMLHNAERL